MAIIVRNVIVPVGGDQSEAFAKALERAGLGREQAREIYIVKSSVDARRRGKINFVYTVGIETDGDEAAWVARLGRPDVSILTRAEPQVTVGTRPLKHRPVVVGFGPAGMFAALLLARHGYRPLVLERGSSVERRVQAVEQFWKTGRLDPNCNVQFGEGGAGTFSDGKLTTQIGSPLRDYVLRTFVEFGAPPQVLQKAKPHIGTDHLRQVVRAIRQEIIRLGGEVRFDTRVEDLRVSNGYIGSLTYDGCQEKAEVVVLAVGHSARDTFRMLAQRELEMVCKPFSVGVRIEHLQEELNRAMYGQLAGHPMLPPAEYKLSWRENGRGVYTFCMCPGGTVVPAASQPGGVVTNGMSEFARDGRNANAAVAVSVDAADFGSDSPLAGMAFQEKLEQAAFLAGGRSWRAPAQTVGRFLEGKAGFDLGRVEPTYALGIEGADFHQLLPAPVSRMLENGLRRFGGNIQGFDAPDSLLTGLETRTSSPVRVLRDSSLQAVNVRGLYPCGEGAGYAGGIMSAAVDGLSVAMQIISQYAPMD